MVILTAGGILFLTEFDNGLPGGSNYNANRSKTGEVLMYVGAGLVLSTITLQIASKINKNKAIAIALRNQTTPYVKSNQNGSGVNPSVNFTINF